MNNKKSLLITILGILGLLLITTGVTYAFFGYVKKGSVDNTITIGNLTFHYEEVSRGILLEDAMPMTDIQGKTQLGEGKIFDFRVTCTTGKNIDIPYVITARVDSDATLSDEYVKVYLTDWSNNEIEGVRKVSSLPKYTNSSIDVGKYNEKVLYEGIVPMNNNNYEKDFRLRMWISDDINMNENSNGIGTYNNSKYKITINVYSEGEAVTDEEAMIKANANINSITVGSNNVIKVDNTHYTADVIFGEDETEKIVPIIVDTENDKATVKIEKVDSLGSIIKEEGIKRLSTSKTVTINKGINYFKITVKSKDKTTTRIYNLTVTATSNYSITYNLNGGTQATNPVVAYKETTNTFNLPIPTKAAMLFAGWYENADFTGDVVTRIEKGTSGSKVYYAKWKEAYFTTDSWETILTNIRAGNLDRYAPTPGGRNNQALREVNLGELGKHYLRVANTTPCTNGETSETACGFVIEFADSINTIRAVTTMYDVYPDSNIYNYITETVYNLLPAEIRNSIKPTTVSYNDKKNDRSSYSFLSNEKIYLLSFQDVFGDSSTDTSRQLDYYYYNSFSKDNLIKANASSWWLRVAPVMYLDNVNARDSSTGKFTLYWTNSSGVSPAFRIG